jgi:hypothetical protein
VRRDAGLKSTKEAWMMRHRIFGWLGLLAALMGCLLAMKEEGAKETGERGRLIPEAFNLPLQVLVPGIEWAAWYRQHSGFSPDALYFGPYVTLAVEDTLYIGWGTARPAESDGALIARYDGRTLGSIGALTEQGVHEMLWDGEVLHIAGTDPCCPDGWEAGNHYTYRPLGSLVKYRDAANGLRHVLHTWGLWLSTEGVLYAAVSSEASTISAAQLFSSRSSGVDWSLIATVGGDRAYDVIGAHGRLYVLYSDVEEGPIRLLARNDGEQAWTSVMADEVQRTRLTLFEDRVLAVSRDRQAIFAIRPNEVLRYELPPGFRLGNSYADSLSYGDYHLLAVAEGYLYALCEPTEPGVVDSVVLRTQDLREWQTVTSSDQALVSLSYWEAQKALILGSRGLSASLWKVALPATSSRLFQYLPMLRR